MSRLGIAGAPTAVVATAGNACLVAFAGPVSDGGSAITNQVRGVRQRRVDLGPWTALAPPTRRRR